MKQLKWEYTLSLLFMACSGLILILILLQDSYSKSHWENILQEIDNVQSSGFTLQNVPSTQFKEHALTDYHQMLERPLFFKERIPIVPESPEEAGEINAEDEVKPAEEFDMTLIGIIDTPVGAYALFYNPKAKPEEPKFQRLKLNQEINGWQIKEIQYDRVIISADDKTDEILLAKPRVHKAGKKAPKTNPFKQKIKKAK
ncbi:hypothetical protein AU255_01965 [Methyloprofundus sedimenti]|uniref:Type II secretion system protein GspC N-terminal domain-containing protein n=1 Tax=Methyloprofundus sedimenti TaxID=1420851 RepID=A0A1V8M5C9_9GAMM|nr:hypothetical protein [Methyloprofundus sedimenti]OQK16696.1 hypothetical protein AU255_01965 [Methyloprofundus sedimenti]